MHNDKKKKKAKSFTVHYVLHRKTLIHKRCVGKAKIVSPYLLKYC
jgi:hypothetical protein